MTTSRQNGPTPRFDDNPERFDRAFERVKKTYATGKTRPHAYRIAQLRSLKKGLEAMTPEFDKSMNIDLGKDSFVNFLFEINLLLREIDHYIEHLAVYMEDECVNTPMTIGPGKSYIQKEPLGVVVVFGAWNFPLFVSLGPMINALAAGNAVVLKPSELCYHTSKLLEKLFNQYLDEDSYQVVNGEVNVAVRASQTKSDMIIFTGSTDKGKLVAKAAAENLVPVILELGGKCPMIVDTSADIDYAAVKMPASAFQNSGQVCIRTDYAFVHESLIDEFMKKMLIAAEAITEGGKFKQLLGHVINKESTQRLCSLLDPAEHKGKVLYGNPNAYKDGNLTPTVVLNPSKDSLMMQNEIFGPILPVFTYKNFDEVISHINAGTKPLAVYYYGTNSLSNENLVKIKTQTSSGAFVVNDCGMQALNLDIGFGGVGASGQGRLNGKLGFDGCSNLKAVFMKTGDMSWPASSGLPPYTPEKQRTLKFLLSYLDLPQATIAKRFGAASGVVLVLIWLLATGRLSKDGIRFTQAKARL